MRRAIQRGWQQPGWINRLLYPLSLGVAALMTARRLAYRLNLRKRHRLPVPLIVVGNLSVGGTGKTPLVMELVEQLKNRGMNPGVISRGYRPRAAAATVAEPRVVREGDTAGLVGDEPLLIFRRCRVPVAVGADRVRSARLLIRAHGCDILLSDDGFQHLALHRDLDIVVVDGERRFGNGWCLPAGPLREPPSALRRADIVVTNVANVANGTNGTNRAGEFSLITRIDRAIRIGDGEIRALGEFAGASVHALAAVGNPQRFLAQLRAHGLEVVPHLYPDHHAFTPADLARVLAAGDGAVLMTEKDAVKCAPLPGADLCWMVPLQVAVGADLMAAVCDRLSIPPCVRSTS